MKDYYAHLISISELSDMSSLSHHVYIPRLAVARRVQLFEDDLFKTGL